MLRTAKQLLTLCEERFPSPRPSQHHNLVIIDGVLILTLMQGDTYQSFDLVESDLDKEPALIVEELAKLLAESTVEPRGPVLVEVPGPVPPDEAA